MTTHEIYIKTTNFRELAEKLPTMAGHLPRDGKQDGWRVSDNLGGDYYTVTLDYGEVEILQNVGEVGDAAMSDYGVLCLISSDAQTEARTVTHDLVAACDALELVSEVIW